MTRFFKNINLNRDTCVLVTVMEGMPTILKLERNLAHLMADGWKTEESYELVFVIFGKKSTKFYRGSNVPKKVMEDAEALLYTK